MRIIIDTNVLASATFWSGAPAKVLDSVSDEICKLVLTTDIFNEYKRVLEILSKKYKHPVNDILDIIAKVAMWTTPVKLDSQVCEDPDDDKFLEAALGSRTRVIISGDKLLLACDGYKKIHIMNARTFIDCYL